MKPLICVALAIVAIAGAAGPGIAQQAVTGSIEKIDMDRYRSQRLAGKGYSTVILKLTNPNAVQVRAIANCTFFDSGRGVLAVGSNGWQIAGGRTEYRELQKTMSLGELYSIADVSCTISTTPN